MDLNLTGKAVLITGGSKGIGLACAEAFVAEGARVAICSRSAANLDAATLRLADRGHRLLALVCDLTKTGTAARLVAQAEARAGGGRS